jgi:alanine dehydrogenase
MKLGIIREDKQPADKRVAFTPEQCRQLKEAYQGLELVVQPSQWRCYKDEEYQSAGISLQENLADCDVLFGIKEVPKEKLIEGKQYFFFSHTIKKQAHNKELLQTAVKKNITLTDYECLKYPDENRVLGFGRYAGIVGTYNAFLAYGKRTDLFSLIPANQLQHYKPDIENELKNIKLPAIKIVLTGGGRVANGAMEILDFMKIRKVTPQEFLTQDFSEPVYKQLNPEDYYTLNGKHEFDIHYLHHHPQEFKSDFVKYTKAADVFISCHFWDNRADKLFTKEDAKSSDFKIKVIADITCDINGSVPTTIRSSKIEEPIYGYNPQTESEDEPFKENVITVMAVDNLPCELPRDSSNDFGKDLIAKVMPHLLGDDTDKMIERATICKAGKLMPAFEYLSDYIA